MNNIVTRTNLSALNTQQRKAVLSTEKRVLVLAGAGSGKTNTLLQKINYLINDEQVDAKNILAITFTKNAANEMLDRMILSEDKTGFYKQIIESGSTEKEIEIERSKMLQKHSWLQQITIKTFHSLCYQIMREDGVHVFDNQFKIVPKSIDNSNEYTGNTASETESQIVKKVAIKLSENREYLITLKRYILDYFVDKIKESDENSEFRPEGKFFTTLNGDKVRSKSEQYIADWLFRNNIDYEYEHQERIDRSAFHPDFFIPSANMYLEHVSNLSYPTLWKEMELKKGGVSCYKTFDKSTHDTKVFNKMLEDVIKGRISKDILPKTSLNFSVQFKGYKKELEKFFRTLLDVKGVINTSNRSIDKIEESASKSEHERVRLFYKVATPIIKGYYDYCTNRSFLDFDGLIEYSLKLFKENPSIRERYQKRFSYVMVDEFQDVNNQQVAFLKYLINNESQLFCVGDDWQSIYGFRGSEIDYIVNFKEHFKKPKVITLNLNYRSTDSIVKASNEIIKKNKFQVDKDITAVKKGGAKIEVNYASADGEAESFIWKKIKQHQEEGINDEEILILYRRSAMKENVENSLKKSGVNVKFKTIHGAKGLEAKVVFILGLNSAQGGFPDPWMQDKIYHVIKKTEYNTLLEEERRLFYVALTRAKSHLYLMSQKGAVSEFVKDIPKELMLFNENEILGIEFEFSVCTHCESKMDEHYKFCAECGNPVNDNFKEVVLDVVSFENIREKVNSLTLKFVGRLDEHIYQARLLNKRAYEPWSNEEDGLLKDCCNNFSTRELSDLFGRSLGGIKSRLVELNAN
jgi:DNA helicase-4